MKRLMLLLVLAVPLAAQTATSSIPCEPINQEMAVIPELAATSNVLSGTLYTVSEQVRIPTGRGGTTPVCYPQWVRAYRREAPANWNPPSSSLNNPMPGPTLRAAVGDVVSLTFLNSIDAAKFPGTDDDRCDSTNVYPANTGTPGDQFPDCFAGSVFTNIHFHGLHTSPNTTADNVFINIKPSPRATGNVPLITAADVKKNFDDFFSDCRTQLAAATDAKMWPRRWSDLRPALQDQLMGYVRDYGVKNWEAANKRLIENGNWPQYFVGAAPYCFKIPLKTDAAISTANPAVRTPHTHGAGQAEVDEAAEPQRPLIMGQSPGTHWYHAHKHGSTTINVQNGMTGAFIIEGESYDGAIDAYYGKGWTRKQPVLVIQQLANLPNLMTGAGTSNSNFSVNGKIKPVLKVAGNSVQLWRIANTSGRAGAYFAPPASLQWKQLAVDGVQLTPDNYWTRPNNFVLASGNRTDLLVKMPAYVKGGYNLYPVLVYNTVDITDRPPIKPSATALTLFTVQVTENGPAMDLIPQDRAPKQPDFLRDVTDDDVTGTKLITFATTTPNNGGPPPAAHTIDGKAFDGELGAVVELNRAEEWKIVNDSYNPAISHPFHIHVNPFQITEIFEPNAMTSSEGKGKVSVANGSPAVTGEGTSFTKDFRAGDSIWIGTTFAGVVDTTPTSDTSMTLTANAASTISASDYRIAIGQYTADASTARPGQCTIDLTKKSTWVPCAAAGLQPDKQRVWWDVFPIPSGKVFTANSVPQNVPGYFKMRSRFVDYPGYFVLHCHILAHEDRGMMTVVSVAPLQTPYSHH
ncbi:MAG TPA: multicopper oxidase domain-containing protein [Thermoanaerobaculia bacterium]|jgi:FtsP/CotA-like multicopper oxidase with cupredoxin domain